MQLSKIRAKITLVSNVIFDCEMLQKIFTLTIIVVFVLTSIYSLNGLHFGPITREEAIEISRNSELVKEYLLEAYKSSIEVYYFNASMVEQRKKGHLWEKYEKVPEGHSVWDIVWYMQMKTHTQLIIVLLDADFGIILHEGMGVALL